MDSIPKYPNSTKTTSPKPKASNLTSSTPKNCPLLNTHHLSTPNPSTTRVSRCAPISSRLNWAPSKVSRTISICTRGKNKMGPMETCWFWWKNKRRSRSRQKNALRGLKSTLRIRKSTGSPSMRKTWLSKVISWYPVQANPFLNKTTASFPMENFAQTQGLRMEPNQQTLNKVLNNQP
jgi:hypothetical protein